MTIEQGLVAHLLADSAVNAITGNRIHPGAMPQGETQPGIVYNRISAPGDLDLGGKVPLVQVRLRVDCWHTSYSGSKTLAAAVRDALQDVGLASPKLLGAEPVQLVHLEDERDLPVFEGDKRDYRVSQDWLIVHLEA